MAKEEVKYKSGSTSIDQKVRNAAKGGVGGAVIGGVGICSLVNAQLALSPTVESYVCIAILIISTVAGAIGLGYITRPKREDGAVVDKS